MNPPSFIQVELLSDTTFSRGEGLAGIVDVEVEHDDLGLPILGGKTLRGLIREGWLNMREFFPELWIASERIFGQEADVNETSILQISDAVVDSPGDDSINNWIRTVENREQDAINPVAVFESLTAIRQQTSEDRRTGAPATKTLRSVRGVIRGIKLKAPLFWMETPDDDECRCLALTLLATRHAGLGRNRGRGHVRMTLDGKIDTTKVMATGERQ